VCGGAGHDREAEVLTRQLDQRDPLNVPDRDGVEGDVDASCLRSHGADVLLDGPLVERVDSSRLGHGSGGGDLLGHRVERGHGTTGEEDLRPLAGEGTGNRTTYGTAPSVDHSVLVLKQHVHPLL